MSGCINPVAIKPIFKCSAIYPVKQCAANIWYGLIQVGKVRQSAFFHLNNGNITAISTWKDNVIIIMTTKMVVIVTDCSNVKGKYNYNNCSRWYDNKMKTQSLTLTLTYWKDFERYKKRLAMSKKITTTSMMAKPIMAITMIEITILTMTRGMKSQYLMII
jgi:hypothetical protein